VNPATALTARVLWLTLLVALATRVWGADQAPREYLDEETGATITVVDQPLVFAFPRTDLAAHARDYATLAAAAVNRSGKLEYVFVCYFWSTVDLRLRDESPPAHQQLVLQADDRRIPMALSGRSAHEAGIGIPVHAPAGTHTAPTVYAADLATLRFIGQARHLTLLADNGARTSSYDVWEDGRPALRAFVRHIQHED
jgi:hypothetical protein